MLMERGKFKFHKHKASVPLQTSWLHRASLIFSTLNSNWCTQR